MIRLILTLLFAGAAGVSAVEPGPSIVFVLADDLGYGDVHCYDPGHGRIPTPNLDRLAAQGTRFTQYYAASPICSPSRCGLITGQYPARWNITSFLQTREGNRQCEQADFLDPAAPSLPRVLKAAGYVTAHIGKWHLGGGRDVVAPPSFEAYGYDLGLGTYESPEPAAALGLKTEPWSRDREPQQVARHERTRWMVDQAVDFLRKHPAQRCFVNLWLDDPHTPWVPAEEAKGEASGRKNLIRVLAEMDRQVGRLMDAVPPGTLLIFASDNGALPVFDGERSAGLRGSKLSLYEGGIRVPLIVRWPGHVPAGRVDDTSVIHAVDLMPTLAALAGAALPGGPAGDGMDVSAALRGEAPAIRSRPLFWEYGRNDRSFRYPEPPGRSPGLAMREGSWKLLVNADGSGIELFNLDTDPQEAKNLADSRPALAAAMKASLLAWRASLPKLPARP